MSKNKNYGIILNDNDVLITDLISFIDGVIIGIIIALLVF